MSDSPMEALDRAFDADAELIRLEAEFSDIQAEEAKTSMLKDQAQLVRKALGMPIDPGDPHLKQIHEGLLARGISMSSPGRLDAAVRQEVMGQGPRGLGEVAAFLEATAKLLGRLQ